jgi:hypothetical protein
MPTKPTAARYGFVMRFQALLFVLKAKDKT